jgi:protein-disulfide isomerase
MIKIITIHMIFCAGLVLCVSCRAPAAAVDDDGDGLTDTGYDPDLFDAGGDGDSGAPIAGGSCPEGSPQPYNNSHSPYLGGEEEIKVDVEVATDFGCPYCAGFAVHVAEVWGDNPDYRKYVRFYFHHHYLESLHPDSPEVHAIAAAVAEQSNAEFWKLHDEIYRRRNEGEIMTPEEVLAYIEAELTLDFELFHETRQSERIKSFVAWDKEQGVEAGVTGTPTLFICGEIVSRSMMENIVDGYLYSD